MSDAPYGRAGQSHAQAAAGAYNGTAQVTHNGQTGVHNKVTACRTKSTVGGFEAAATKALTVAMPKCPILLVSACNTALRKYEESVDTYHELQGPELRDSSLCILRYVLSITVNYRKHVVCGPVSAIQRNHLRSQQAVNMAQHASKRGTPLLLAQQRKARGMEYQYQQQFMVPIQHRAAVQSFLLTLYRALYIALQRRR